MKIAILSDIHSNFHALWAVYADAEEKGVEYFWLLGDIVGYGPHPVECLQWLRDNWARTEWVMGNHDAMLLGLNLRRMRSQSAAMIDAPFALAELKQVTEENDALVALRLEMEEIDLHDSLWHFIQSAFTRDRVGPLELLVGRGVYWLVHASHVCGQQLGTYIYPWSPHSAPSEMEGLLTKYHQTKLPICQFHGHSHVQYLAKWDTLNDRSLPVCVEIGKEYELGKLTTLCNPGSVGQPRNGDPRACYAVLDTNTCRIAFSRVSYDYRKTASAMTLKGYPDRLVRRLVHALTPSDLEPSPEWRQCLDNQKNGGYHG